MYLGYDWLAGTWDEGDDFPIDSPCGHVGLVPSYDACNMNESAVSPLARR